jgi:hypothetical protein
MLCVPFRGMKNLSSTIFLFLLVYCLYAQDIKPTPDPKQFPKAYPNAVADALLQLQSYPSPRYLPGNHLARLFEWLDPNFLGGAGQPDVHPQDVFFRAQKMQRELILNWNYGIVIPNAGGYYGQGSLADSGCALGVKLANEFPQVSLDLITFWMAASPQVAGYPYNTSMILNQKLDSSYYIHFDFYGNPSRQIKFNFPEAYIKMDGAAQRVYIEKILHCLRRPINRINEDGEEPPGPYLLEAIRKDPAMIHMKDSMKIASWDDFMSVRKLQMRKAYANSFMSLPALKNTQLSFYTVEGGPVDRFTWPIQKKIQSPLHEMYYSTPDFYPRWPSNWKDWKGPWHGWRWIEIGRQREIADGDKLFSPFISPGWSPKQEEDIRPGQWLGLLKCLGVVGAEFYYVGYFNLNPPFNKPALYIWQAAMPAYAQAVTSRYEDVLRDGNVFFDSKGKPIITYHTDDPHVLITARKHSTKEKYVICGTLQPFENGKDALPEKKMVDVQINGKDFSFEIRRQGSVYVYEELMGKRIFYQLDGWHENAHPDFWSTDFRQEAELADAAIPVSELFTESKNPGCDFREFTSFLRMSPEKKYDYTFQIRDSVPAPLYLYLRYRGQGTLTIHLLGKKQDVQLSASKSWTWYRLPASYAGGTVSGVLQISSVKGMVDLDSWMLSKTQSAGLLH